MKLGKMAIYANRIIGIKTNSHHNHHETRPFNSCTPSFLVGRVGVQCRSRIGCRLQDRAT